MPPPPTQLPHRTLPFYSLMGLVPTQYNILSFSSILPTPVLWVSPSAAVLGMNPPPHIIFGNLSFRGLGPASRIVNLAVGMPGLESWVFRFLVFAYSEFLISQAPVTLL